MATHYIEIHCTPERLEQAERSRERLALTRAFRRVDRAPVVFSFSPRFLFDARGVPLGDYYDNPRTQLEQQILDQKWLIENLADDRPIDTTGITVHPDLSTLRGGYFDVQIRRFNDGTLAAEPILNEPADVDGLEVPPVEGGHFGRMCVWFREMCDMAADYAVTLNGRQLPVRVSISGPGGPIPDAYALAGQNLFLWARSDPQRVHRLLDVVTQAFVNFQQHVRRLRGDEDRNLGMGADAAEMFSAPMFEEFVVPYYTRCYEAFPGARGLHMCGRINHLVPIIADRLKLTSLDGFGFPADPQLLVERLGGRVVMVGGINPVLLLQGTVEAIREECLRYLAIFRPCGGYVLQDGNNVAPGTPMAHLNAALDAAREFGAFGPASE